MPDPAAGVWIAMIRGIGPWTHKKMSMADLRNGLDEAGLGGAQTILATGNVVLRSGLGEAALEGVFTRILEDHDLDLPVYLRSLPEFEEVVERAPWPDARRDHPSHVLVTFLTEPVPDDAVVNLAAWQGAERIATAGREVFVDYAEGIGTSRLTFDVLEKMSGRRGTSRNWNTVTRLIDRARTI